MHLLQPVLSPGSLQPSQPTHVSLQLGKVIQHNTTLTNDPPVHASYCLVDMKSQNAITKATGPVVHCWAAVTSGAAWLVGSCSLLSLQESTVVLVTDLGKGHNASMEEKFLQMSITSPSAESWKRLNRSILSLEPSMPTCSTL